MKILFFGSTSDSVLVLEKLSTIVAVVTQPPRPIGRKQIMTSTPVEQWAKNHTISVLSFPSNPQKPWLYENEEVVADTLAPFQADLLVSASYGVKIPNRTIREAQFGGINIHPSLLPRWRGADPVPWAILSGDHQIGVSLVTITENFDSGDILAQKKIPITNTDTSDPLRTKLFTIGADLLTDILASKGEALKGSPIHSEATPSYARKFTREDGFEPWERCMDPNEAVRIERKFRALHPWPGLWTLYNEKRLKILSCHLNSKLKTLTPILVLDIVQLEGKKPVSWEQFSHAYLTDTL